MDDTIIRAEIQSKLCVIWCKMTSRGLLETHRPSGVEAQISHGEAGPSPQPRVDALSNEDP